MLRKLSLLAVLPLLAGCQTTTATVVTDTSCLAFKPITWSGDDTVSTRLQVQEHNKVFDTLCKAN